MKTPRYIFLLVLMGISQLLSAQDCDPAAPIGGSQGRSVLEVIMGSHPRLGSAGLDQATDDWFKQPASWDRSYALELLDHAAGRKVSTSGHPLLVSLDEDSSAVLDTAYVPRGYYYEGMLQAVDGNYGLAVESFTAAELSGSLDAACRMPYFKTIAQYLEKYGDEPPLFPGFNGGFYNFTCDSLQWRFKQPDSAAFHNMLRSLMDMVALSGEQPVYYELMGDLLIHHPDPIKANWFGCLSYFRLAFDIPSAKAVFEEKAIYALEAPEKSPRRFDNYQFNQLRKRLAADLDSAAALRSVYLQEESAALQEGKQALAFLLGVGMEKGGQKESAGVIWMHENEAGELPEIIREADRRRAEMLGENRKFAGEVDLKKVKGEASFNFYGIAMILVVIGAVVLIWVKMARGRKQEE